MIACLEQTSSPTGSVPVFDSDYDDMIAWRDRRDQDAAQRMVEKLSPLIRNAARRSLPRPWMVEDAVQNTLANLFRSLDTFDPRVPLGAWTVCLAKNVCANMMRSWGKRTVIGSSEFGVDELQSFEQGDSLPSLHESIIAREELGALLAKISALAPTDREIATMLFIAGFSSPEVSERTGLSSGAVRVRAFRIRAILRHGDHQFN